jgi:hypothetical protein
MAALRLNDFPRARQLLKARRTTLILDEECWRARKRRVGEAHDAEPVRAALRWDAN